MIDHQPPRWHYWINPGLSWFENFAQHFVSPDITISPEDSEGPPARFAWTSRHLDDVTSKQEFVDRTSALKAMFDGAMFISFGPNYPPIELTDVTAEHQVDNVFLHGLPYPADVRVAPYSAKLLNRKFRDFGDAYRGPVPRHLFLARYDEVALAILKFTGVQKLSYVSLYAFKDWMKDGGWNDARIAKEAGWSAAELNDFTNTANNPAYLGPFCRHGGTSALPRRPMPLEEADAPMRKAIGAFLLERAKTIRLREKWNALAS